MEAGDRGGGVRDKRQPVNSGEQAAAGDSGEPYLAMAERSDVKSLAKFIGEENTGASAGRAGCAPTRENSATRSVEEGADTIVCLGG